MAVGIVRAVDSGALWREAAEEEELGKIPTPPTSAPPTGATSDKGPELAGQGVVAPNSNKFKTPANGLKKVLDTTAHPSQGYHPESTKAFEDWATKQPAFTKTYFKPHYQDALKAHLGEDNYSKLLHHAPTPYTDALTLHQQAPAPKSNKFTTPANTLKKLLEQPHTTSDHVQEWMAKNPGFAKTYLGPTYTDALKGHLGDKNYSELQTHLSPKEKAQEKSLGNKILDIHKGIDPAKFDAMSPGHQQAVLESLQKAYKPSSDTHSAFQELHDEHFGQPQEQAQGIAPGMEGYSPQAKKPSLDSAYLKAFPIANPPGWDKLPPEQQKQKIQNLLKSTQGTDAYDKIKQIYDQHFGQPGPDFQSLKDKLLKKHQQPGDGDPWAQDINSIADQMKQHQQEDGAPLPPEQQKEPEYWKLSLPDVLALPGDQAQHVQNYLKQDAQQPFNNSWTKQYLNPKAYQKGWKDKPWAEQWVQHLTPEQKAKIGIEAEPPGFHSWYTEQMDSTPGAWANEGQQNKQDLIKQYLNEEPPENQKAYTSLEQDQKAAQPNSHQDNLADLAKMMQEQHSYYTNTQDYKDWAKNLPPGLAASYAQNPAAAKESFEDHLTHYYGGPEDDELDDDYDDEDDGWPDADEEDPHQEEITPNHQNLVNFTKDNPEWSAQHSQALKSPEFKQWFDAQPQHYQDKAVLSPSKTMEDFAQSSNQGEINKIQDLLKPVGEQNLNIQHPALMQGIKKIFPQAPIDPDSTDGQMKQQLESWLKYLPDHEGFGQHVPQLQQLYNKFFGGGSTEPDTEEQSPQQEWEQELLAQPQSPQQDFSHNDFFNDYASIFHTAPTSLGMWMDHSDSDPEAIKQALSDKIKDSGSPSSDLNHKHEDLKALYNQYFGDDDTSPAPSGGIDINTTKPDKAGLEKIFDVIWPGLPSKKEQWVNHNLKDKNAWTASYYKNQYPEQWAKAEKLFAGGEQQTQDFDADSLKDFFSGIIKSPQAATDAADAVLMGPNKDNIPAYLKQKYPTAWSKWQKQQQQSAPSGQQPYSPDEAFADWKKIYPNSQNEHYFGNPEDAKSFVEKKLKLWQGDEDPAAQMQAQKLQKFYDKHFGGGAQGSPSGPLSLDDWNKILPGYTNSFSKALEGKTADEQLAALKKWQEDGTGSVTFKDAVEKAIAHLQGGPSKPTQPLSEALENAVPGVFDLPWWDKLSPDAQKAQLQDFIQDPPKAGIAPQLQQLYDQYFGSGQQEQKNAPFSHDKIFEALDKAMPGNFAKSWWKDTSKPPEMIQKELEKHLKLHPELQPVYDKYFGGGTAPNGGASKPKFPTWPEDVVSGKIPSTFTTYDSSGNKEMGKLAPGAAAFLAEYGVTPDTAHKSWNFGSEWSDLSDQQKQKYIDMEGGGDQSNDPWPDKTTMPSVKQLAELGFDVDQAKAMQKWGPEDFWKNIEHVKKSIADGDQYGYANNYWGKAVDKWSGQDGGQQAKPTFNWDTFGPEFVSVFPNTSWGQGAHSEQDAQVKLKSKMDESNASYPGTEKTEQINKLYQKWFGGTGTDSDEDDLDPSFKEEEPQEPAKAFKTQEVNPQELQQWAGNKPQNAADWKNFSNWWGDTKLSPDDEAGLYKVWFGKDASPEQANEWFQSVFEHNATPSQGDLGSEHTPGWAHNSWAFGDKADKEWPVFKAWAKGHPGLPKNTNIKQKLQIWNGLSDADKSQIAGDYAPESPVDNKAVVKALKAAYPDSDWSKWSKMSQGTLQKNLQGLAEKGYAGAIPVFNQFFNGNVPLPEEKPAEETDQTQPAELPPVDQLPGWVQSQMQDKVPAAVQKLTKDYLSIQHLADSVGLGDAVNGDAKPPAAFSNAWKNMPDYLKAQVDQMDNPPWSNLDEFEQWQNEQPKAADAIKEIIPGLNSNYYPWNGGSSAHLAQGKALGSLIDKQDDPQTKQKLLDIYSQYFGHGKTTLAESLNDALPGQNWDKLLQTKSKSQVASLLKKQLKTEQDPVKWAQAANVWSKHFAHPDNANKVAPTGIKALTDFFKYNSPGKLDASDLARLIEYKQNNPNNENTYINWAKATPETEAMAEAEATKKFLPYHGWTPPSSEAGGPSSYTPDPAIFGDKATHQTYTAPEDGPAGKEYSSLLSRAKEMSSGFFSDKDKATLKSDTFANWFSKAPLAYRQQMQDHPGSALDDFDAFMSGGKPYQGVPEKPAKGKEKFIDVSPFGAIPKRKKNKGLPVEMTHNPSRDESIKFPRHQDTQETLPLGPGERWAPKYAPMPIYRVMPLDLDRTPGAPEHLNPKQKMMHVEQQKARLRRIDEIINGTVKARNPQDDMKYTKQFAQKYGLGEQEQREMLNLLYSEQPDLFSDDKWGHLEDFARKHGMDPKEMHELADKLDVGHPTPPKGNYDHPELGQLLLDYIENTPGKDGKPGMGWHWTRDIDKLYKGIPAAGINPSDMKGTDRHLPVLLSGLWGGQGEGEGHGGAYDAMDNREREHNLYSGAPVHMRRVQIRSPDEDWHDTIDYGPMSLWPPGRDETASGKSVHDKPNLAKLLSTELGKNLNPDEWNSLTPGHAADNKFQQLIHDNPQNKDRLLKLYKDFFVGRPDLHTKPHTRHAGLLPRSSSLDERNPAHLFDLAQGWGVKNPERYGLPSAALDFYRDLKGVGWTIKEMVKEHGLGKENPRRGQQSLAAIEARIMALATVLDELPSPDWMSAHGVQGYDDPEEIKDLYENNPNSWVFKQWKDDQGIEDEESPYEGDHYDPDYGDDDEDDEYDDEDDYDPDDFHGDPPMPTMDRPKGWPQQAPFLKNDPRGRQYFPPQGLNGPSDSEARPDLDWQEAVPEHPMLPIPRNFLPAQQPPLGGQHQLFDVGEADHEWPNDTQAIPMYRGMRLDLSHPDLAHVRRSLLGDNDYDKHYERPGTPQGLFDQKQVNAAPHPLGYDNPALGEHILNHVQNTNKEYQGQPGYGMGPHWSKSESTAQGFAATDGHPLSLPTVVRSQWKGLGEDPYRTNTQGHWDTEHEITMLPGAKMNVDSVKIQHPQTKAWHEVLPQPTQKHADRFSSPHAPIDDDEHASRYYFQTPANEMVQDWHDVKPWHREDAPKFHNSSSPGEQAAAAGIPVGPNGIEVHTYSRDPQSGAGNCSCGRHKQHHLHDIFSPEGDWEQGGRPTPYVPRKRGGILTHSEMRR